jgi:hypothetical protein
MSDNEALMSVETIRQKIVAGLLPCDQCRVLWAGPGSGSPCAVCGRPVSSEELEYECEQSNRSVIRFHYACYVLWDQNCRELQSQELTEERPVH